MKASLVFAVDPFKSVTDLVDAGDLDLDLA